MSSHWHAAPAPGRRARGDCFLQGKSTARCIARGIEGCEETIAGIVGWVVVNLGAIPGVVPIDPYPFPFLALFVAVEAIFLSTFVLMTQKRQTRQADHWAHLNLQIGLLGEQETTKVLQMLKLVCDRLGLDKVAGDGELKEMVGKTSVGMLAQELAQNLEKTRDLKG